MGRKIKLTFSLIFLVVLSSHGQYAGDYEYTREFVWGITKATNSGLIGGVMFKHTRMLKEDLFHGGQLEIVNIKHPQEQKFYTGAGNTFIWGKENYLYSIRFSYSREYILFRKAPQQGVQINLITQLGPTIGLESPYYIEVAEGNGRTTKVPYDAEKHNSGAAIVGNGNFLQGLFESSVVPGLNARLAFAFEFGSFRSNVVGIETGFQSDFFIREINMIPTANNQSIFPNAYFTLFYGSRK